MEGIVRGQPHELLLGTAFPAADALSSQDRKPPAKLQPGTAELNWLGRCRRTSGCKFKM